MLKFVGRCFLLCVASFISLVIVGLFCLYLAISNKPFQLSINSNSSIFELKNAIETESMFISSKSNATNRKVIFSAQEINSAFNLYLGANQLAFLMQKPELSQNKNLELRGGSYEDGAFILLFSQKMSFNTPFGGYLNFYVKAEPSIKYNNLKISVQKCKVGSLPVPSFAINYILKEKNTDINNLKEVKLLISAVEELTVQADSVTVTYNPEKLSELITKYSSKFGQ